MSPLRNNLKHLVKENDYSMAAIKNGENRNQVSDMIRYLTTFSLPVFQVEVISGASYIHQRPGALFYQRKRLAYSWNTGPDGSLWDAGDEPVLE